MKTKFFPIAALFILVFNCTTSPVNDGGQNQILKIEWHLTKVQGGIAGVNHQVDFDKVVWIFNAESNTVIVQNDNTNSALEDSFDSGTYEYTIGDIENKSYIYFAETDEYGNIEFNSQDEFVINQNITSTGLAADGYIYTFTRRLVVTDGSNI
jgi:hypothetical protein